MGVLGMTGDEPLPHEEHCDSLRERDRTGVVGVPADGVRLRRYVLEDDDDPDEDARFSKLGGVRTVLVGSWKWIGWAY